MSGVARISEDYLPNEPTFQALHVATVAFNSLLLGQIVVPDWDVFFVSNKTSTQSFNIPSHSHIAN